MDVNAIWVHKECSFGSLNTVSHRCFLKKRGPFALEEDLMSGLVAPKNVKDQSIIVHSKGGRWKCYS